jgi:integrase
MTLIKRNKVWHYQTKINGKTFRRSTGQTDRRRAEQTAKQIKAEVRLRKKRPEDWLRLSQAMDREVERIEGDTSPRQAERTLSSFAAFLKWLGSDPEITAITPAKVEEFQRYRLQKRRLSRSTVSKDINSLLLLMRQNGIHLPKPLSKGGNETEIRPFSHKELVLLFREVTDHYRPLYVTLLFTGARPAELLPSRRSAHRPLLKREVDLESGLIHLRQAKKHPGRRVRGRPPIPVADDVVHLLREQVGRTTDDYPFVFTPAANLARDFDATLRRSGIPKVDGAGRKLILHSFRHTYATLMATQAQNNPHFLKALLGHSQISTTDRYCQVEATVIPIGNLGLSLLGRRKAQGKGTGGVRDQVVPRALQTFPQRGAKTGCQTSETPLDSILEAQ